MATAKSMTPAERVNELTSDYHREILIQIIDAIEENCSLRSIIGILSDFSLIELTDLARGGRSGAAD